MLLRIALSAVLAVPLLAGCGGAPDPEAYCLGICERQEACDLLDVSVEDCVDQCEDYADNLLPDFREAYLECAEAEACDAIDGGESFQDACYDVNTDLCTTDTDAYVEAACRLTLDCDGNPDPTQIQLQDCMDRMHADGNIFICMEEDVVADLLECVTEADECNPNPVNACVLVITGIELGNDGQGND